MLGREFFKKPRNALEGQKGPAAAPQAPDGMFVKCPACGANLLREELERDNLVCKRCRHHFRMGARRRIALLCDEGSFEEWDGELESENVLDFPEYETKLAGAKKRSGERESVICGEGKIDGQPFVLCVMDPNFMMGSMGRITGEKIASAFERATAKRLPVVVCSASGGARMQEGILSLMQMAKTSGAIGRHSRAGLLYVTVLTDPTLGGVSASFAMEGDIILSEPGALIGFAGPRVIEQTIRQKLPAGFQSAEFQREKGFVDAIVQRGKLRATLSQLIALHCGGQGIDQNLYAMRRREELATTPQSLTPYQRLQAARGKNRPTAFDFIERCFEDFVELHGDRRFGDDKAVVGGIARLFGMPVTVIGIEKGRDLKDRIDRNFGLAHPEGYRKALRLMRQAEKFRRPVVCLVDTSGAFCGIGAEERGQSQAIAENLQTMMELRTPVISVLIGEGGSGGALALAVADEVWMLENAVYSVISPEGCASILWKNSSRVAEACDCLKLTAPDLLKLGVIERVIAESEKRELMFGWLKTALCDALQEKRATPVDQLLRRRYERFRKF